MNKTRQILKYFIADYFAALIAWFLFFTFRKYYSDNYSETALEIINNHQLYFGLVFLPVCWVIFYYLIGTYDKIYRKSRLKELGLTLLATIVGVTIIFFILLLDDDVRTYKSYYYSYFILLSLHFFNTFILRFVITTHTAQQIRNKKIGFNTFILGCGNNALNIFNEIESQKKSYGNKILGYVEINNLNGLKLKSLTKCLGEFKDIDKIIEENKIEEVIIAVESNEHNVVKKYITKLEEFNVLIKIIPDIYDIMLGSVKMTAIFDTPLIQISKGLLPPWQFILKNIIDKVVSVLCLILLSPLYLFVSIGVKLSSKGPIFYSHERIGLHGKPFKIIKFRSMYVDAEQNGPALSNKTDSRITPFGRFLRKVRLDEIPQFYNVLIGEMSLVGPRPERQHFIDLIVEKAPHYRMLLKVKPGITSWGQVKFGYAENVEQMIERLKYDILYIENMSLAVDFKILIYTVIIVIQGRGK